MHSYSSRPPKLKWMLLYQRALSEGDDKKRLDWIALAKGAVFRRKQQLAHSQATHVEERVALEDAAYVLASLRRAAEFNRRR